MSIIARKDWPLAATIHYSSTKYFKDCIYKYGVADIIIYDDKFLAELRAFLQQDDPALPVSITLDEPERSVYIRHENLEDFAKRLRTETEYIAELFSVAVYLDILALDSPHINPEFYDLSELEFYRPYV